MTKIDDKRITPRFDRRRSITDDDRAEISRLHAAGTPIREIARLLEGRASRRSIQFIIYPERLAALHSQQRATKHHLRYYDRDARRKHMASHRTYKKRLVKRKAI